MKAINTETVDTAFDLPDPPEGWEMARMEQIAQVVGGGTPKTADKANFAEDGFPWITPADLSGFEGIVIKRGNRSLSEKGLRTCSAQIMPKGTVLMSSRAPIGYLAIAANPLCTNQGFKSFVCHPDIIPAYVFFWLKFISPFLQHMGSGSTFLEISGSRAGQIPILLPPTAEQRRIVSKVEELLARVNATKERLAKVALILKRFRQAVLAAACSGRLTAGWSDRNSRGESANNLLEKISLQRQDLIKKCDFRSYSKPLLPVNSHASEVPEGWTLATVDQLTSMITSGSRGWAKYYSESGPMFIRAQDINTDLFKPDNIAHVHPPITAEGRRTRVCYGDLLITITGANVAKSALVDLDPGEAYVSQHVALIRPVDLSIRHFMLFWIISPSHGRAKLLIDAYGAGKPGLNLDNIREMIIALPPLAEQLEIVKRTEALFKLADSIEKRVTVATSRANKLTQAILGKAFRGELVPTEAELARREGRSYEPASALLARIRAEHTEKGTNLRSLPPRPKKDLTKSIN